MRKVYVLYHGGGCRDGFASAWIAHRALRHRKDIQTEYIPVQYGQRAPKIDAHNAQIFLLDFCYPLEQLIEWHLVADLVVIDHHKTAAEIIKQFRQSCADNNFMPPTVYFNICHSGVYLSWLYYCCDMPASLSPIGEPLGIVQYVEDRDLWAWKLPNSRAVNAAIRSYPLDFAVWDAKFGEQSLQDICLTYTREGEAILRAEDEIVDAHVRNAREVYIGGHNVRAVNATVLFSEIAGKLAEGRPFGACYFDRQDGKRQWSLRSREDGIDVSEVAKIYGGGGHPNAAGFSEDKPYLIGV